MWQKCIKLCLLFSTLSACTATSPEGSSLILPAQWLNDTRTDKAYFSDPQPSGLTYWQGQLVSLSDASAAKENQRRLHFYDPQTADVTFSQPYTIKKGLATDCFNQYLMSRPDLEALSKDPKEPNSFITVTEDASRLGILSPTCRERFKETGSTRYPTVLVRLKYAPETGALSVTGVRAVQFAKMDNVGNMPNDGIEGVVATPTKIYLGLEKDRTNQAQVFTVDYTEDFWTQPDFVQAQKSSINFPNYNPNRPNPINGIELTEWRGDTWLLAAARNDNELWWVNLSAEVPTVYRTKLRYRLNNKVDKTCPEYEFLNNASLEGIAINDGVLYAVNDPWKVNYHKNIQCQVWQEAYRAFAPQLYQVSLDKAWAHAELITPARDGY